MECISRYCPDAIVQVCGKLPIGAAIGMNTQVEHERKETKKPGGAAPYGYQRIDGIIHLHPEESNIRKQVFELFLIHNRKLTVATILNEQGHRTRGGKEFSDTSIDRMLRDPIVRGQHKK